MRLLPAAFAVLALAACSGQTSDASPPAAATAGAPAADAKPLPEERYASTTAGFDLTLPGIWTGRYRTMERKDSTMGSRLAVDFKFVPDSGSKAPSLNLMTLRIFPRAVWDKLASRPGGPVGSKLGERGNDIFVLSLPQSNPYPPNSPEAPIFDKLIISLAQGGQQVHLTPR